MRVALITPYYRQSTRGNAVTVRRIEKHLGRLGCTVAVFSLDTLPGVELAAAVRAFAPDIVHAFHATRCGALAADVARQVRVGLVVTITGTELYRGDSAAITEREAPLLETAAALVAFHGAVAARMEEEFPQLRGRVKIIPQGVEMPDMEPAGSLPESPFVFLLPAGLRPVKDILCSFSPLEGLWRNHPRIRLVIAGPVLDGAYARTVMEAVCRAPFASWAGEVPFEAMGGLYRSAHVVLNTSLSEGGMANGILEGMARGKPVLASGIEGNRSLVVDGGNGLLFASEQEFLDKAERLLLDREFRSRIGAAGRAFVESNCSPLREAEGYRDLYLRVI